MTPHCLWHLQRTCLKAIRTLQQHDSNKNAADPDHQEATSGGYQMLEAWSRVPRPLVACSGHNFYWSWQPEPVSHPMSFPVYTCTPGVQMVPPGTRHQHCTSSCISLETFTCFEMCSCLKTVFMTVMTVMRQFVKFSVLQCIFYNHCDVIKVVSLSRGSYPQYQAPGAHRSRLHSLAISWELGATIGAW